jgi:predicted SPOUT superfamily RNA methylase MTH1
MNLLKNLTNIKSFAQVQDEQYAAALAKPVEQRNFMDKSVIKTGNHRHGITDEFGSRTADTKARDMQKGITAMARKGYTVAGQSAYTPKKGGLRIAFGGPFLNTVPRTTVTFVRQAE